MKIDIASDVVCPWCIIGYKQLERALHETGIPADIHWHPFELNPDMAAGGENLREHLAAKYGTTPDGSRQARECLTTLGADLGFEFNYADDMRMVNTFRAHQLIHWAEMFGRGHDMKMALFVAFFTHRRDLDDTGILASEAGAIGLDGSEARAVLADGRFAPAVRSAEHYWLSRGVRGVPAIIFEERYLLTGAQGVENYATIAMRVSRERVF